MFKLWSIKNLLQLWSLATIVAIVVIAAVASYTNSIFSAAQQDLTKKVLPMAEASQQMSAVTLAFITRQKQVVTSSSIGAIDLLHPREQLESQFHQNWLEISDSVSGFEQGRTFIESLNEYYQQFLAMDSQLIELIRQQHRVREELQSQIKQTEQLEQQIQNQVEAISGRINLQYSRYKRKINSSNNSNRQFTSWDNVRKLSQSVHFNALKISYLTQKLIQTENTDNLLSIRDNDIRQHGTILTEDIAQLRSQLHSETELLIMTEGLAQNINKLISIVIDRDFSVYSSRIKQIKNQQLLILGQQGSISSLKVMTDKLNELSSLVNYHSLNTVNNSIFVAEKLKWLIILLSLFITFGMIRFISAISRRINQPLAELRNAMHSLSSQQFDTRLAVNSGKSEFIALSMDFNSFAQNTQMLIADLAKAKDSIQIREQHISAILNGVPEAVLTLSSEGIILSTNARAEQVLNADEQTLLGLNLAQFFHQLHRVESLRDIENLLISSKEFEGLDYKGQSFSMWLSLNLISSLDDDVWVCVISDITAWKRVEGELKVTSSELNAILENAMVGIALIKDRVISRVNNKFEQIFSYDREMIEGQSLSQLYPSEELYQRLGDDVYDAMSEGGSYVGDVKLVRQDGSFFWGTMSGKALDADNPVAASIWLFEDITLQREKDDKLSKLANFDSLTGLANRNVFNDRIEHAIHQSRRTSSRLAIFFLDLDHFKNINDSLGHKAGDILLCEVAERLKTCIREGDTVARLGGDEFTIILEDIRSAQHVAKVADKVLEAIGQPYMLHTTEVNISPSIGISLFPADGRDADVLLRNADAAMYHAKNNGRNNFQFYSSDMNAQAAKRLAMETSLRRALDQDEFYLHFQPQIDLVSGDIIGAEALLRWDNEQWGNVSPAEFVPILEDTGLISAVGELVIKQAIEGYLSLKDQLHPDFLMAVNLSGRQFQGGQLAFFVSKQLEQSGMLARNLELEITETVLMDDTDLAITTLNALSDLGITLAIDDFGTGYSSLSYLKRFPLNVLKVDRSFVNDVTTDPDDAAIVDAILAMSKRLNLTVIAEGVETAEQLAFLRKNNCERVQGYFFSKPLALEAFADYVAHYKK